MAQLFLKLAKDFDMEKSYSLIVYKEYLKTINPNYGIHDFDKIVGFIATNDDDINTMDAFLQMTNIIKPTIIIFNFDKVQNFETFSIMRKRIREFITSHNIYKELKAQNIATLLFGAKA